MRIDYTRIIFVIIGFYIAQILIHNLLLAMGLEGIAFVLTYNLVLSFVAALIYVPSSERKGFLKDLRFYKCVSIFFLIFLVLSLLGF